ncbi:hypothetical protein TNCV_1893581 [Trichonephila clavipes]|nr:hypothetical protein TNCV_1893581 [Trichonephila clavipes]
MCCKRHERSRAISRTLDENKYAFFLSKRIDTHRVQEGEEEFIASPDKLIRRKTDWACVLLSDENRFSIRSDGRQRYLVREWYYLYRRENIQEKNLYPIGSIMQWVSIIISGCVPLYGLETEYDKPTNHLRSSASCLSFP